MKKRDVTLLAVSVLGVGLLWLLLSIAMPYEKPQPSELLSIQAFALELHRARLALFAIVMLTLLYLGISFVGNAKPEHQASAVDQALPTTRWMLLFYILFYWYNQIMYLWFSNVNIVLGMGGPFGIWPLLLLLNGGLTGIFLFREPWRHVEKLSSQPLARTLLRLLAILVANLFFQWFSSAKFPIDGSALISSSALFAVLGLATLYLERQLRKAA